MAECDSCGRKLRDVYKRCDECREKSVGLKVNGHWNGCGSTNKTLCKCPVGSEQERTCHWVER